MDTGGLETVAAGRTALSVAAVRPDGERAFVSDFACLNSADESVIDRGWATVQSGGHRLSPGRVQLAGALASRKRGAFRPGPQAGRSRRCSTRAGTPAGGSPTTLAALRGSLAETTIFMPNQDEAPRITGSAEPEEAARALAGARARAGRGEDGRPGQHRVLRGPHPSPAGAARRRRGHASAPATCSTRGSCARGCAGETLEECLRFGAATAAVYIGRGRDRFPSAGEVKA